MYGMRIYFIIKGFNLLAFLWIVYLFYLSILILGLLRVSDYRNSRSLAPVMTSRTSFYPQSRQLGVGVEVELKVDLVLQVVVDREVYETMNPQHKTI